MIPICVQCGTGGNPCRCKVVGPTLGLVAFLAAGVVEWPVGALVYIFKHAKGRRIMGHPATHVYPKVSRSIPIWFWISLLYEILVILLLFIMFLCRRNNVLYVVFYFVSFLLWTLMLQLYFYPRRRLINLRF